MVFCPPGKTRTPANSTMLAQRASLRSARASTGAHPVARGRLLLACVLLGMAALADAQTLCEDTRNTRKCMRKIARRGWNKCSRPRFQARCRATCNTWDSTICSTSSGTTSSFPRPTIANACGCTVYRGVSASSTSACVKREYFNGAPAIICQNTGHNGWCQSDFTPCPYPPPSPPPPSPPPPSPPPTSPLCPL